MIIAYSRPESSLGAAPDSALEPLGRLTLLRSRGLGHRQEPPSPRHLLGSQRFRQPWRALRRPTDGSIREYSVKTPNIDWEDIATDDLGHLYIGEIGNNGLRLPLRAIYRTNEPDPSQPATEPLPVSLASFYKFPPGKRFDAESLFLDRGRAIPWRRLRTGARPSCSPYPSIPRRRCCAPHGPNHSAGFPALTSRPPAPTCRRTDNDSPSARQTSPASTRGRTVIPGESEARSTSRLARLRRSAGTETT